jgi:recombination protein RecT
LIKFIKANLSERQNENSKWVLDNLIGAMVWSKSNGSAQKDFISGAKLKKIMGNSPSIKQGRFSAWDDWGEEMLKAKAIKYIASKLPTDDNKIHMLERTENVIEAEISKANKQQELPLNLNSLLDQTSNEATEQQDLLADVEVEVAEG